MKFKTKGIVFNFIKYRETSIIARIYTDEFGMKSYIINNVRSVKPRYPVSFFQPLTMLEMVVYNKAGSSLNRVAELKCARAFQSIPYHIVKSTVTLFLTEILYKILHEEEPNSALFRFIDRSFCIYDASGKAFMNFHLQFLLKLSEYLGIRPEGGEELIREIKNEIAVNMEGHENISGLNALMKADYTEPVSIQNSRRRELLAMILLFYRLHFSQLQEIRSLGILKEVFNTS